MAAAPLHTPAHKFELEQYEIPRIVAGPKIEATRQRIADDFPLEPYEDIVFIEQEINDKSAGGLILPGESSKLPAGRVVAVGPGRWFHPPMDASGHNSGAVFVRTTTSVGDYVVFGRYQSGGEPLEINGKRYLLAREGDLAGRSRTGAPIAVNRVIE